MPQGKSRSKDKWVDTIGKDVRTQIKTRLVIGKGRGIKYN